MRTRDSLERREIEKYSSSAVPTLCLCCIAQFRYFNNNWMVYQLQNFLDELFKLPSNSSNPLPQKWPLISLSLSSFQIFQKYFFVLKPLLKPFQTNTQITFHRFSFPFTFLQFFFSKSFRPIVKLQLSHHNSLPSFRRDIQLLFQPLQTFSNLKSLSSNN